VPTPSLTHRIRWASWLLLINGLLATLLGLRYLPWIGTPDTPTSIYVALLYAAQFPLIALLAGLPLLLVSLVVPARKTLTILAAIYCTLALTLLGLDTISYALYRFHLNGFVLEMAMNGGTEVFSFSWQTWLSAMAVIGGVLLAQLALGFFLWHRKPGSGWLGVALATIFGLQATVHGWHAWADANYDTRITSVTRHIPLYYAATAKRFMNKHGFVDQQKVRNAQSGQPLGKTVSSGQLNYPAGNLSCNTPQNDYNLLMIVIDGARWDMVDPRWMPNTHEFAAHSLNFVNHYSNGNATKPGIFTLFYSLPASYWDAFTAAKAPPVWITRLQELDYATRVLGSATLVSPAFDQNVFASIDNLRLETPGEEPWDRDIRITDDWLSFTREHQGSAPDQPFFGFLFYDTPHNHRVPEDYPVKFQPYWESVNKLELDQDFNPQLMENNYKSTLHFVDNQIGRVLQDLRDRNLLESTIVMITGDHGQEFNEHRLNYWGHGSNFGDYQLRVPMVVHWPGKKPEVIGYRTENFDVAPTLMTDWLGCSRENTSSYATGNGLFRPRERDWSIAHSYMDYALLTEDFQVVQHASGNVDVMTNNMTPVENYRLDPRMTREVLEELSKFYE